MFLLYFSTILMHMYTLFSLFDARFLILWNLNFPEASYVIDCPSSHTHLADDDHLVGGEWQSDGCSDRQSCQDDAQPPWQPAHFLHLHQEVLTQVNRSRVREHTVPVGISRIITSYAWELPDPQRYPQTASPNTWEPPEAWQYPLTCEGPDTWEPQGPNRWCVRLDSSQTHRSRWTAGVSRRRGSLLERSRTDSSKRKLQDSRPHRSPHSQHGDSCETQRHKRDWIKTWIL